MDPAGKDATTDIIVSKVLDDWKSLPPDKRLEIADRVVAEVVGNIENCKKQH